MLLYDQGKIRLDDPVAKYLPPSVRVPARDGKQITLLDLATQSSGLPRLPSNMPMKDPGNPYADYTVQQLYDFLSGYQLTRGIGEQFEYSNLGVGLLGHALALRAGKSYEALLTERVLRPLGMEDTRITLTPSMRAHLAVGHGAGGDSVGTWDLPTLAGAGALRSTADDMLKFLAASLDSSDAPVSRALRDARRMRRPAAPPSLDIGLGWLISHHGGRDFVWHNGETGGYHTFIGFEPARRVGVVVLSNSASSIDDIGIHLLDEQAPLAGGAAPKARTAIALDSAAFDAYVGRYQLAPTFVIAVTREGSRFFVQATGQPKFELFAESPTDFFLKAVDAQITFVKDASGRARELILHQGGLDQRARRVE
jgi:CubicO group peptidase (beta-lactamase class C family)